MVLIGLLVVALVCVVVGLVLASVPWLIASMVVSVVAAGVLVQSYLLARRRAAGGSAATDETQTAATEPAAQDGGTPPTADSGADSSSGADSVAGSGSGGASTVAPPAEVWVVDGEPEYHVAGCALLADRAEAEPIPLEQAVEDGFVPCDTCRPPVGEPLPAPPGAAGAGDRAAASGVPADAQVEVADGYPEYHVPGCGELAGLDAEPISYEQAVEDGFQPCVVCNPDAALAPAGATAYRPPSGGVDLTKSEASTESAADARVEAPAQAPVAATELGADELRAGEVLVIDGFPHYHLSGCRLLAGHEPVAIPLTQATEDGFTPCDVCEPDQARESAAVPPVAPPAAEPEAPDEVWVVDGFPDYHREQCPTLAGLPAEPVPHDQAVEDGFAECQVCLPEAAEPSDLTPPAPEEPDASLQAPVEQQGEPAQVADSEQASEPSDAPDLAEVWVVDGYPNYHRPECGELVGLPSQLIPYQQAVEDGFGRCPICLTENAAAEKPAVSPDVSPDVPAEPTAPDVATEPDAGPQRQSF